MVTVTGAWTTTEAEEFLQSVKIPIRLATRRPDASLWMVSLWYRYRDGSFECATWAEADVVGYLRNDSEVAFDVSTNHPPYRGVRGSGHAALARDSDKELLRALLLRYLGGTDSRLGRWLLDEAREEVRIRIRPRTVYSWDYTDRMRGIADAQ